MELYKSIVRLNGFEPVLQCRSGEEIVEAARKGMLADIDAIIMDYRMKETDGFEAAIEVLRYNPNIQIIIASADESIKKQALEVGFKYLRKPFTRRQLMECIS